LQKRQVSGTIDGMRRKCFSDEIRAAVDTCGQSRYRLCTAIGLDQGAMSKSMSGKAGLSLAYLDKLADVLDLHIVAGRQSESQASKRRNADGVAQRDGMGTPKGRMVLHPQSTEG
jgi:hypothetical protein